MFPCAYGNQSKLRRIPGSWSGYQGKMLKERPVRTEFQKYLLYMITDKNKGRYVGEHQWNEKKTIKQNLDDRMRGHLDKDADKNTKVHEMIEPKIKPFYGKMNDKEPYYIYGTYKQILKVEKAHIRWVMDHCKKKKRKYYNKDGTETQPVINEKKLKEYNVVNEEIRRVSESMVIDKEKKPSKSNPDGETYVIHNKELAAVFGKKKKLRCVSKEGIERMRKEGIGKLCMVTVDRVEKVIKN